VVDRITFGNSENRAEAGRETRARRTASVSRFAFFARNEIRRLLDRPEGSRVGTRVGTFSWQNCFFRAIKSPQGPHTKIGKLRNGAIMARFDHFPKSKSIDFHAGDRGSNPLGDAKT